MPSKYIKEHNALIKKDYIELLKNYKGKVLAITGMSDVQADYKVLDEISSLDNVTVYTPSQVNQVLRDTQGESSIMNFKKEYKISFKKPISLKLKKTIEDWSKKYKFNYDL